METFSKWKNSSAYFRKLMWKSIPWDFQPKATKCQIKILSQKHSLFHVTRDLDSSNVFAKTRKWIKILWFPKVQMFVTNNPYERCMGHFRHQGRRTTLRFKINLSLMHLNVKNSLPGIWLFLTWGILITLLKNNFENFEVWLRCIWKWSKILCLTCTPFKQP